jgi:CRISPR-associated protein Csb2
MFALEVEFLTGVSVAAKPNRREESEWPPHPDRLFQALVAAWAREEMPDEGERAALEWLEGLPTDALIVSAPKAYPRDVVTVYVPPNDARTTGKWGDGPAKDQAAAIRVIPDARKNRQPRAFPAMIPAGERALVHFIWPIADGIETHRRALERLAAQVTYVGHSHSLVRLAVVDIDLDPLAFNCEWVDNRSAVLRLPHEGRLRQLIQRHERANSGSRAAWPLPSLVTKRYEPAKPAQQPAAGLFDPDNCTVLADDGGFTPSLDSFPLVAKRLRDALLKLAPQQLPLPALLSGHDVDRRPTAQPHIAIIPLADVGWTHSIGRLMGLALVWPRDVETEARKCVVKAIAAFVRVDAADTGLLHFGRCGSWRLTIAPDTERRSLRFERYTTAASRWGTVLPMVLDRHPKNKPGEDLATIIATACISAGLPSDAVDGLDIEVHKHSPVRAAPSAREVERALPGDSPYRGRPLCHLVLKFARPVRGPLIVGAGRFRGLGLCLPLDDRPIL